MINNEFCANAIFANFFTNSFGLCVDAHAPHPMMNLWEHNNIDGYFELDGWKGLRRTKRCCGTALPTTFISSDSPLL